MDGESKTYNGILAREIRNGEASVKEAEKMNASLFLLPGFRRKGI